MYLNRKIKSLIFATFCFAVICFLAGFVSLKQDEKICKKVTVNIDNEYNNYFISDLEVKDLLTRNGLVKLEGLKKEEIDLKSLELRIKSHKFVKNAQVSRDLSGNLNVTIKQNRPIARIIQLNNSTSDVYIDAEGNILPLSERYTARVIPITRSALAPQLTKGFFQDSVGQNYLALLHFIEHDPFWKAQLAGMHIDGKGRVTFLPQVGDQTIEFGKPVDIEQKFKKLLVFYKKVMPTIGWDTYKRVNIEFNNQIVCE